MSEKRIFGTIPVICTWCEEEYQIHRYRIKTSKFCSFSCHQQYKNSKRNYLDGRQARGKRQSNWKGNNVGYRTLHKWVQRWLGKAYYCSNNKTHKATRYHWANISGEYKRNLNDWKQLCPKCNCNDNIKIPTRLYERRQLFQVSR